MIKAVLFDLDNTLYDYDVVHNISLKAVHKVLNSSIDISFARFLKLFNLSKEEIHRELSGTASSHNRVLYFQRLIEKTRNQVNPSLILKLYDTYWDTLLKNMKPYNKVIQLFSELKKRGLKIAIVSDLTTRIQLRKIQKLKIAGYIDALVTSEEAGSEKPHAIMFLLALNKLGLSPNETVMVGDNAIADIEGANFVGIETVLLAKGKLAKTFKEDYRKPDFVVREVCDVLKILDRK